MKEWLADPRIRELDTSLIINTIDKFNEETNAKFELLVEKQVDHIQKYPHFQKDHLEEYFIPGTKVKRVNYKYFCIENGPYLIDTAFLYYYLPRLDKLICNLRNILIKYITLYEAGKIASNAQIVIEKLALPENNHAFTLQEPTKQKEEKIVWADTPEEFVKTFQPLIKQGTLKYKGNSDTEPIVKRLYDTFRIGKTKGDGELALSSLSTYFKKENSGDDY